MQNFINSLENHNGTWLRKGVYWQYYDWQSLGVCIDNNLRFDEHIHVRSISKKSTQRVGVGLGTLYPL